MFLCKEGGHFSCLRRATTSYSTFNNRNRIKKQKQEYIFGIITFQYLCVALSIFMHAIFKVIAFSQDMSHQSFWRTALSMHHESELRVGASYLLLIHSLFSVSPCSVMVQYIFWEFNLSCIILFSCFNIPSATFQGSYVTFTIIISF